MTGLRTWLTEHGPHFEVPAILLDAEGMQDLSWKNDACPCLGRQLTDDTRVVIWCGHPDPDKRESYAPRFQVGIDCDGRNEQYALRQAKVRYGHGHLRWEGDDPNEALRHFMVVLIEAQRALSGLQARRGRTLPTWPKS